MRVVGSLVILALFIVGCSKQEQKIESPIVKVGDRVLTQAQLDKKLPSGLTPEDSLIMLEHFVKLWINDNLIYDVAQKNILDKENMEQLVENYRRSLIIYQYKEQLVNERLSREISAQDMLTYFEANKEKFKLERPLIKGLYLKVPVESPQIENIRKWSKNITPTSIVHIEKYCVQNGAAYDYFKDSWLDFYELIDNWPVDYKNESDIVKKNKNLEQKDGNFYYFLHISDYLLPGDNTPFEYAEAAIKEILINQRRIDFLKKTEEELYQKALNNGQIIYYNK